MASDVTQFGLLELSAIREMSNIGLGHAAKALTEITGHNFNMDVPHAQSVAITNLPALLGSDDEICVGIYMPIDGDGDGHIAFLFPWRSAQNLWTMVLGGCPESPEDIDELGASAMLEVGNIINGSFLNAIADASNLTLHATPPLLAVDYSAVILDAIVSEASQNEVVALAIETNLYDEDRSATGTFVYIPTKSALKSLFLALGIPEAA